mmetsp:Transcript_61999/g.109101  ORF Transcript_61999/g.109101 Transcript_61999/m.109101 type:complete len:225 (-) Transcript_61999:2922-3596(-)
MIIGGRGDICANGSRCRKSGPKADHAGEHTEPASPDEHLQCQRGGGGDLVQETRRLERQRIQILTHEDLRHQGRTRGFANNDARREVVDLRGVRTRRRTELVTRIRIHATRGVHQMMRMVVHGVAETAFEQIHHCGDDTHQRKLLFRLDATVDDLVHHLQHIQRFGVFTRLSAGAVRSGCAGVKHIDNRHHTMVGNQMITLLRHFGEDRQQLVAQVHDLFRLGL